MNVLVRFSGLAVIMSMLMMDHVLSSGRDRFEITYTADSLKGYDCHITFVYVNGETKLDTCTVVHEDSTATSKVTLNCPQGDEIRNVRNSESFVHVYVEHVGHFTNFLDCAQIEIDKIKVRDARNNKEKNVELFNGQYDNAEDSVKGPILNGDCNGCCDGKGNDHIDIGTLFFSNDKFLNVYVNPYGGSKCRKVFQKQNRPSWYSSTGYGGEDHDSFASE